MYKTMIHLCAFVLLSMFATANTRLEYSPFAGKALFTYPFRFKTYSSYLQYHVIRTIKGVDSANVFYAKESEKRLFGYTDYLPLSAGSSFPLSGTLYGTAGFRLSMDGSNSLYAGYYQQSVTGTTYAINMQMGATGELQLWNYNGAWNKALQIDNSSNTILYGSLTGKDATFTLTTGNGFIVKGVGATPPGLAYLSNNYFPKFFTRVDQNYGITIFDQDHATAIQSADLVNGNAAQYLLFNPYGGNVGVGTTSPSEKLSVNGNISTKKLIVTQTGWSDYVFRNDYKLRSLSSLEQFIQQNKHLPGVPSAKEVEEKGISVGDNQALLLKKIEELTLYMIQQQKQIDLQAKEILQLKKQINKK